MDEATEQELSRTVELFVQKAKGFRVEFERFLKRFLDGTTPRSPHLEEALKWALQGGGKRLRPLVCLGAAEAVGGSVQEALPAACAIELLHTYTLVHDDLPAMDNDTMRRGKASVWSKFGEANAILAGDALQALAFQAAALSSVNPDRISSALAAGAYGVVAGQVADLEYQALAADAPQRKARETLDFIYEHKTGDLFQTAATMGALAGKGDRESVDWLGDYGMHLGFAFQYEDDRIDGDSPVAPKELEALIDEHTRAALEALQKLPGDTSFLQTLARTLVSRTM